MSIDHELLMMGITAVVCLPVGYVFGTIIQRWRDVREFEQEDQFFSELQHSFETGKRAA